jgi:hypothetical protein
VWYQPASRLRLRSVAPQLLPAGLPRQQVKETVHDVQFLHNEQFFAAAQRKYTFIYDKRGLEVHRLSVSAAGGRGAGADCRGQACMWIWVQATQPRSTFKLNKTINPGSRLLPVGLTSPLHDPGSQSARAEPASNPPQDTTEATRLEFLPHHFLLCSVGSAGVLRYQDTSTGQIVATHRTKLGACDAMRQNPWNAVLCLGHGNGTVTMWTPNISAPVVKMLCHHGPVRSLVADTTGRHLATAGADGQASDAA